MSSALAEVKSPTTGPTAVGALDTAFIEEARRNLQQHKDKRELSETDLAARISKCTNVQWSGSAVGGFLRSKYGADESSLARCAAAYLEVEDQRLSVGGELAYVRTTVARDIERAVMIAEKLRMIAIISTSAGCGKSRIIAELRSQRNSIGISCSDDLNTRWALAAELLYKLTRDDRRGRSSSLARRRIEEMLIRNGHPTIFVDEAQKIGIACVDYLRQIADQSRCPLIIFGNEQVYEQSGGNAAAHAQYSSRVVARVHISIADLKRSDLRLVAQQLCSKTTVDLWIDIVEAAAKQEGGFRTVKAIIEVAKILFDTVEPTRTQIIHAIQFVKGGAFQ